MARVIPHWTELRPASAGELAELDVLRRLGEGLPAGFTVLHSVDWSTGTGALERHGEVDVAVVAPAGDLLLVEVKSGFVQTEGTSITKRYGRADKDVLRQVRTQYGAMRSRLADARLDVRLHHLLVLTDVQVRSQTAQWPRERIVDCDELDDLPSRVETVLGHGPRDDALHGRLVDFLRDVLDLVPDVSVLAGSAREVTRRLAEGLATWVPRLTVPSGRVRVQATAGSGKTQLALTMLRAADAEGRRCAYVCFNRVLADHMARLLPARVVAETFHELAVRRCRAAGSTPDFSRPGALDACAEQALTLQASAAPDLDFLVVDELQDLQPAWVQAMLGRLHGTGRALLLEDPDQQLYPDRHVFHLPEAVGVTCRENFRSPRQIVRLVNALGLASSPVAARGPLDGELPDPLEYVGDDGLIAQTDAAVRRCLAHGFAPEDIAILTPRGRDRSLVLQQAAFAGLALRRYTGAHDPDGQPVWTAGPLLAETVRRFKGQAAPAIVLTECDFAEFDELTRRLLFVAMTRAQLHLEWVLSARATRCVADRLAGGDGGAAEHP